MIEAKDTSHSGAISKSGGKLATSANRLVSLIARLSNDAMRVARDSTNPSRSESGNDRLTYPYSSARSPGMSSAPSSTSSARPRPIRRGSRAIGPPPGTRPAPTSHCDNGFLAARKTHVAGQRKLASDPGRTAADRDNGYDGSPAEAYQHVRKGLQARGSGWQAFRVLERREEVIVHEEETFDGAIKDNDLHMLIGFERHDDLVELRDRFGSENIKRWMIERNPPIRWQAPLKPDLLGRG